MLQESVNRFETEFVDEHSGRRFTVTFWRGEPVVYHPPHLPSAAFTHISFITKHYFVVGHSTTGRMVPLAEAHSVLQLKLSLLDVEREVHGSGLDAPERLLWRRWLEAANQRAARKSKHRAHCCGKYKLQHQLEVDDAGLLWCAECWNAPNAEWQTAQPAHPAPNELASNHQRDEPNPNEASDYPWRQHRVLDGDDVVPPPKRMCVPCRGFIDQTCDDGSCHLASFEHCQEQVLIYQKDVLGVPVVGDSIEAWRRGTIDTSNTVGNSF